MKPIQSQLAVLAASIICTATSAAYAAGGYLLAPKRCTVHCQDNYGFPAGSGNYALMFYNLPPGCVQPTDILWFYNSKSSEEAAQNNCHAEEKRLEENCLCEIGQDTIGGGYTDSH